MGAFGVVFHVPLSITETGVPSVNFGTTGVPYALWITWCFCSTLPAFTPNVPFVHLKLQLQRTKINLKNTSQLNQLIADSGNLAICQLKVVTTRPNVSCYMVLMLLLIKTAVKIFTHTLYLHVVDNTGILSAQIIINCSTAHQDLWGSNISSMNAGTYVIPPQIHISDFRNDG